MLRSRQFWVQSGVLSLIACLVTFALILVSSNTILPCIPDADLNVAQRNICYHARKTPGRWRLIKLPMDIYFVRDLFPCLLSKVFDCQSSCLCFLPRSSCLLELSSMGNGYRMGSFRSAVGAQRKVSGNRRRFPPLIQCLPRAGVALSVGGINVATSTLVRPLISQPSHQCIPTLFQAIALHTFIMAWFSKGFHALKTACIVISIPWIFSFLYFLGIGVAHRSGPDMIFRPAPVSTNFSLSSTQTY